MSNFWTIFLIVFIIGSLIAQYLILIVTKVKFNNSGIEWWDWIPFSPYIRTLYYRIKGLWKRN